MTTCARLTDARRAFVRERTGVDLEHAGSYSFDPGALTGNVEQFVGVAQVPIGLAGPLLVNGEHVQGEFYVPHPKGVIPPQGGTMRAPVWS
jgi:hydroxymethylglutaryl-CoA reductase (NADPH)